MIYFFLLYYIDMTQLTKEEQDFLEKRERRKQLHNEAQKRYIERQKLDNPNFQEEYNRAHREYYHQDKEREEKLRKKLMKEAEKVLPIVKEIYEEVPNVNKRTRRGKKKIENIDVKPLYLTRKEPLELSTINTYIDKLNIISKFMSIQPLSQDIKQELHKLIDDKPFDEKKILKEFPYLQYDNIEDTIDKLRQKYKNDNSFKSYINVLVVLTSHIPSLKDVYQILTKLNIDINKTVQSIREENIIAEDDKDKIINLDEKVITKNLEKFDNIEEKLIYALYTLFPARRLDYKDMKLTNETEISKLKDTNYNYLVINDKDKYKFIFNNYKTYKKYGQQVFEVPDNLAKILNSYIFIKKIKPNQYLFHLERDAREPYSEGNFSKKVIYVFKKIYNTDVSARFLRMSWVVFLSKQHPSLKERKELAFKMAHSPNEQLSYNKIIKS